jgi:hypothetical protein
VWNQRDLVRIDDVVGKQPGACTLGHHHDARRSGRDLLEHQLLVRRRRSQHCVRDHDRRHVEQLKDLDDIRTVEATVYAVLVLHDRHVELVELRRGRGERGG